MMSENVGRCSVQHWNSPGVAIQMVRCMHIGAMVQKGQDPNRLVVEISWEWGKGSRNRNSLLPGYGGQVGGGVTGFT